ncbi:PREDICTED: mpv17-like protein 2 isoform X3 [Diuraphis noxia]|uniref:mpv17-like protein 2 isoform X3 n=1 Tax=Diuraphis noxia TaxID=143948 RepID=UPI000763A93E|nr:PREDICTED: mpv17-like protein 2 isoform X3 [Diuraphis noxia]
MDYLMVFTNKVLHYLMSAGRKICAVMTRTAVYVFDKYHFAINTFSGSAIMCVGDIAQQNVERYHGLSEGYDWSRTARIAVIGSILGSVQHIFYRSLDNRYPARDGFTISKKIFIDQMVCTPFNIVLFIYGLGFLEHKSLTEINEEFKDKCAMIFLVDCAVFVPTQYINFKFLDPKYRLLFTNMVSIMYDTFLSYIKYTVSSILVSNTMILILNNNTQ